MQIELSNLSINKKRVEVDMSDIPIEELALSARAYNVLKSNKLESVNAIIAFGLNNIIKLRNAGIKTVREISNIIKRLSNSPPAANIIYDGITECTPTKISNLANFEELIKKGFDEKVLNTPIEELNLSVRALNALNGIGLRSVKDIIDFGLHALQKRKNVGRKTINNITEAILAIHKSQKYLIEETSFVDVINDLLAFVTPKYLPIIKLRYGYDDGKSKTLEEIGNKTGITRERVRQIIVKEIRRIKYSKWRKLQALVENIEKLLLQYNGIISINDILHDTYFASGNKNQLIFLMNFLIDCYEERYRVIYKKFLSYLSDNEIKKLHSKIREAALKCQFPIDEKDFYKNIMSSFGSISKYYLSYYLLFHEHIELSQGKVLSPGRLSIPDRIKLVLGDINRPIHFSEIAKLYKNHFGGDKIKTKDLKRAIHARISDSKDFIIVDRGTFTLRDKFTVPDNIEEIVRVSKEILQDLKSISDTKYLINELKKLKIDIGNLNAYSLKAILLGYPDFIGYRKFEVGIEELIDKYERKPLEDLIFEILSSTTKPMHVKTIWREVSKQRGYPEYAIEQRLAKDSRFIRVAPANYTIAKNISQYEKRREIITNFAREWIHLKRKAISAFFISEVLKETKESSDFSLGLVEQVLSTDSEFIILPNGFYNLKDD